MLNDALRARMHSIAFHAGVQHIAECRLPPKNHASDSLPHLEAWIRLSFQPISLHAPLLVSSTRDFVVVVVVAANAPVVYICVYMRTVIWIVVNHHHGG
jgi:hypothetical protein